MKKFIKLFIINAILLFLIVGLLIPFKGISAVSSLSWFDVKITPSAAGENAEYLLSGGISEHDAIDTIRIQFQWDTTFQSANAMYGSIVVNGVIARAARFEKLDKDITLTVILGKTINKDSKIEILIKKEAGIVNPTTPRICFAVRVTLISKNVEEQYLGSSQYEITQSIVTIKEVRAEPPIRGSNAEYFIQFITGVNGRIRAQTEDIRVKFPEGTSIGTNIFVDNILINNTAPAAVYKDPDGTIRIYSNTDIKAKTLVSLYFKKSTGIINPKIAGSKVLKISTYIEPEWVDSPPYEIIEPEVKDLKVIFDKNFIGARSNISISFKTSAVGFIPKGGKIYVEFPGDFKLPSSFEPGVVKINGKEITSAITLNNAVEITAEDSIYQNSDVSILISENSNIINPMTPATYSVIVYTDSDSFKKSALVEMLPSSIDELSFSGTFSGLNSVNEFKISFKTGPVYTLQNNVDIIIVKFDDEFVLPETPVQDQILVNGAMSTGIAKEWNVLYITVPVDIMPQSFVEVQIPEAFGIKNPANLGEYGVKVSTTKETEEVESNKIKITPLPVVEFTVNPSQPDGMNGFYKTNPEIMLFTSNGVKVFFKIDEKEFNEFSAPFKITEGNHTVFAYAVDSGGNKGDVIKKEFAIDTTPPEVKIDNTNSNPSFKGSPGNLSGRVSEPCTLKINEAILELKDNLNFLVELNVYEGMPIAIYARDLAGNANTLLLTAHIDNKPPTITILKPYFSSPGVLETGLLKVSQTTDSSVRFEVQLDEKGKVFINSKEMTLENGVFVSQEELSDGENEFLIRGVDSAGNEIVQEVVVKKVNEKVIKLQIGNKDAYLGDLVIELEAPPFIEKGFTLVPLRFISEAFGAEITWNSDLQVININYKTLTVQLQIGSSVVVINNTEIKKLDAPPKIVNGRTFIPIRFISETFGATVDWDGTTKTITITYKP